MEKKLKTIEYELTQTEKRLEDLLAGIKQLRKEVSDMLPPEVKKVLHKRVVLNRNDTGSYIDLNDYFLLIPDVTIKNYVRYITPYKTGKYTICSSRILLSIWTAKKEIILTYIPNKNLVIIVER